MSQQARSILVQKAAVVGGEDFTAHCGEEPQWSQEVARYIYEQNLIVKIDSDRCLRGKSQFLVGFDFGRDACQCCGRGVGQGTPAWRQQFISGELRKVKAAAEKAERDAGNLVDPAVAKAERDAAEKDRAAAAAAARQPALEYARREAVQFSDSTTAEEEVNARWVTAPRPWFVLRQRRSGIWRHDHYFRR